MTGSGACVFAEFSTEAAAEAVLKVLPQNMCGFIARGLHHHPMREFAA
jgi:4-diphosphocytidyl-2-C-methyl-D-erythritol kinase